MQTITRIVSFEKNFCKDMFENYEYRIKKICKKINSSYLLIVLYIQFGDKLLTIFSILFNYVFVLTIMFEYV